MFILRGLVPANLSLRAFCKWIPCTELHSVLKKVYRLMLIAVGTPSITKTQTALPQFLQSYCITTIGVPISVEERR
jgi:hypothetical protein